MFKIEEVPVVSTEWLSAVSLCLLRPANGFLSEDLLPSCFEMCLVFKRKKNADKLSLKNLETGGLNFS